MKSRFIMLAVVAIAALTLACPSCKLLRRGVSPEVVTEKVDVFLPTAKNVCDRTIAYEPDNAAQVLACERMLEALRDEDGDGEIRVAELRDMLWVVPVHNSFVFGDPNTSNQYMVTADALKFAIENYLGVPHAE